MARTPFDLSFEDLARAGAKASKAAREEAERAGVPVAMIEPPALPAAKRGARKRVAQAGLRRRLGG